MEKKQYIDIQLVKDLMEKLHLDNRKMAERMGVSPATVKRLFDGADQSHMSCAVIIKLARAVRIPAQLLIHKDYC